ncbi:lactonase family protein [Cellulomonas sp. McL0617]|uniref:lactonase family protein n=1 Tax=Cellulomonas sp. McL0617 TaxID=3415675 RepID=UPI003CF6D65D
MKRITRLGAVVAVAAVSVLATSPAFASVPAHHGPATSYVYVPTNDPAGNVVRVLARAADGSLSVAGSYATGGVGGALTGAVVDRLASQGSAVLDKPTGLLYVVNAGSDTVSVFSTQGDALRLRDTVATGGDFPVSVAVHDARVYVLNARGGASVQGFLRLGAHLVTVPSWHRDLGLDPTATPEFTHTPGQVAFTPDGRSLLVTTKAASNAIDVFTFGPLGRPSAAPVVASLPGKVPFALVFDPSGNAVVAEAAGNVATFRVAGNGALTQLAEQPTGQAATCWIAGSGAAVWASNAGSGNLSGFTVSGAGALTTTGLTGTLPGTVDATVSAGGRYLDVQTGAQGTVDTFRIGAGGALTAVGSVVVPGTVGGEGIASS